MNEIIDEIKIHELIKGIVKPELLTEVEIINDPDFMEGAMQGEPRAGHPEGKIIYHIEEVLANVDKYAPEQTGAIRTPHRARLRAIALIHDTFKHRVDYSKPKSGENHHAMIARRFAEHFIYNKLILDIIELHDEAYNAWSMGNRKGDWEGAEERAKRLINRLQSHKNEDGVDLYLTFYRCDNETGDKTQDSVIWFEEQLAKL